MIKNMNSTKGKAILLMVLVLLMSMVVSCTKNEGPKKTMEDTAESEKPVVADKEIIETIDGVINWKTEEDELGEWEILSIQRDGREIPEGYLDEFKEMIDENKGEFESANDYSRILLTGTALGLDGEDVFGYNVVEKIYNDEKLVGEFTSTAAYGLIALDSKDYSIPEDGQWTREEIVDWLLKVQNEDGGFGYEEGVDSDVDMTAMIIQALSNYQDKEEVKESTEKALNYISERQEDDGGFISWDEDSSESVSQTILALTSLNIDPKEDERFVKESNLVDKLLTFKEEDGGFLHTYGEENESDGFATEQALRGLVSYNRFLQSRTKYYDMTDIQ